MSLGLGGLLDAGAAAGLRGWGERWALWEGDGPRLVGALPPGSVDACITDPPYAKGAVPLYGAVAEGLQQTLKPGGSYLAIVPHWALPVVLADVAGRAPLLRYRWTFAMWQGAGPHARLGMGIEVSWKPVVWWVKGPWPRGRGFVRDGFESVPPSGKERLHRWQQGLAWAAHCLRVVPDGGVVLDPLCGTGTVGVACAKAGPARGLRFMGVDVDPAMVELACRRLEEASW